MSPDINGIHASPNAKSTNDELTRARRKRPAVSENMVVVFDELDTTATRRDALLAQLQG